MAKDKTAELRKGDKVVAATNYPECPQARQAHRWSAGLQWTSLPRRFDNGVSSARSTERFRLPRRAPRDERL